VPSYLTWCRSHRFEPTTENTAAQIETEATGHAKDLERARVRERVWIRGRRRWGFGFKRTASPTLTRSLLTARDVLGLQRAFVVHAGEHTSPLEKGITALAAARLPTDLPSH
jgi:hypothetical protein